MEKPVHCFHELFAQLGLPNGEPDITTFLTTHRPLAAGVALADAPFWSPAQAMFLQEAKLQDADWAALVDQLNLALR